MAGKGLDITDMLVDILVGAVIFGALFPTVNTAIGDMGIDNVTLFGTAYDFSWAGYLLVLAIILTLVYVAVGYIRKKKR